MNLDPEPLQPGATIGLLGGGQLAQMLVLAGHAMGFRFLVLEPNPDCPAALAGTEQITASYRRWACFWSYFSGHKHCGSQAASLFVDGRDKF